MTFGTWRPGRQSTQPKTTPNASASGCRACYAKPGRGMLQGGGTPGGLGLDQEFLESVLVPQVMLYGFLGFTPTPGGYELHLRLRKD